MGLEMNFDRSCTADLSPNTVLLTHGHRSHVENRSTKGKLKRKDDLLSIREDFVEISFHRYRSASCKSVPSRPVVNVDLKRGSIYQSSKEVQYIKKMGTVEGRRKVQMPRSSDEESSHNRSLVVSLKSDLNAPSVGRPHVEPCSSDSLIDICMDPDNRENHSAEALRDFSVDLKLRSDAVARLLNKDSARLSRVNSKTRFSLIRKMFDPFMKSKSLRTPSYVVEPGGAKTTVLANMTGNRTWKADNAINWVYTFHSIGSRKKSNASGWGLYGSDKDSSMVGQMQVSCYLCSELKDGVFENSMVTEFVLYDIAHARQTCAAQENSKCTPDDVKPPKGSNPGTVGATLKPDESCPTKVKFQ
ncbi:hypothetical protein ACFX2B_014479 [Malus domestica]